MAIQKITSGIIADGAIVVADIADGSITTAKIADANVTASKLASGAALPSQSGNTTYYLTTDGTSSIWKAQTALAVANTQISGRMTGTQVPLGSVLQIQSTTKSNDFTTTNTSWHDITGLSVSITPISATSKIMVFVNLIIGNASVGQRYFFKIVRNSTDIAIGDSAGSRARATGFSQGVGGGIAGNLSATYLDSPATTSSTTYKVQTACLDVGTIVVNRTDGDSDNSSYARGVSSITVMEIAA